MPKKTVLITGASGFLGSWLVREFVEHDYQVLAIVRSKEKAWRVNSLQNILLIESKPQSWPDLISLYNPNVVISADWDGVEAGERNDRELQKSNIGRVLAIARSSKVAGAEKFLHLGSQSELGQLTLPVEDDTKESPITEYAKAKVELKKQLFKEFNNSEMQIIWARIFSVYGPLEESTAMIPSLLKSILSNQDYETTSGNQEWSYLYASDFALAIRMCVEGLHISTTLNIGNPTSTQIKKVFEIVSQFIQNKDQIKIGALSNTNITPTSLQVIPASLIQLNWRPKIDLENGLRSTLEWWKYFNSQSKPK